MANWHAKRITDFLDGYDTYIPAIQEAGFLLEDMSITIKPVPEIALVFSQKDELSTEMQEPVLNKYAREELLSFLNYYQTEPLYFPEETQGKNGV